MRTGLKTRSADTSSLLTVLHELPLRAFVRLEGYNFGSRVKRYPLLGIPGRGHLEKVQNQGLDFPATSSSSRVPIDEKPYWEMRRKAPGTKES
jgi:hypothetical protein